MCHLEQNFMSPPSLTLCELFGRKVSRETENLCHNRTIIRDPQFGWRVMFMEAFLLNPLNWSWVLVMPCTNRHSISSDPIVTLSLSLHPRLSFPSPTSSLQRENPNPATGSDMPFAATANKKPLSRENKCQQEARQSRNCGPTSSGTTARKSHHGQKTRAKVILAGREDSTIDTSKEVIYNSSRCPFQKTKPNTA